MYFLYDLSLSEIADECQTTRAAAFDLIKRTSKLLNLKIKCLKIKFEEKNVLF